MKMRIFAGSKHHPATTRRGAWIEMYSCFCKDKHHSVPVRRERGLKFLPEDDLKITSGRF